MKKIDEEQTPGSCLNKAADDEPIFVLRAQDRFAPAVILIWAEMVEAVSGDIPKVTDAVDIANDMRGWQAENPDKVKVPD